MESVPEPDEARAILRDTARASAAPYVDFPRTPAWYPPAVGLWMAAGVAIAAFLPPLPVFFATVVAMLATLAWFLRWYTRLRGTMPTTVDAPAEFRPVFRNYYIGVGVIAVVLIALVATAPPVVTTAVAFAVVTAACWAYERAYANAAAATRERLA